MNTSDPARTIADAALAILARRGIGAVTVRAVANAAGVSTTGIYTYFGGKAGLLDALFGEGFDDLRAFLAETPADGAVEELHEAMLRYREWAMTHPTHYQLMFSSRATRYQATDEPGRKARATYDDLVARTTLALASAGRKSDADAVARHLWSSIHGYVMLEIVGQGPANENSEAFYREGVDRLIATHVLPQ